MLWQGGHFVPSDDQTEALEGPQPPLCATVVFFEFVKSGCVLKGRERLKEDA